MSAETVLHGYTYSVYTRSVRMALYMKGVDYQFEEIDPFDDALADGLRGLQPFGRVPILDYNGASFYETQAILDFVDGVFDGLKLTPETPHARARMRQVMGIVDSYLYWPLVRQAFSHAVFSPLIGEIGDAEEIKAGLQAAPAVLDALEDIAAEGAVLVPSRVGLADCHLWPMLDYFRMVPGVDDMLSLRPALEQWVVAMSDHRAAMITRPDLAALKEGGDA